MTFIEKIRAFTARHALERKIKAEMSTITDAELDDLNLSRAKIAAMSHAQAWTAVTR